jgi:hypothetical protein
LLAPGPPIVCAPWLSPEAVSASLARDVVARNGLDDRNRIMRIRDGHAARLKAQATAKQNRTGFNFYPA